MEFDKVVNSRKSVRFFKKTKKVDYRKVIDVLESGLKVPLAGNIYSLRYILVSDKNVIKELADACQQDFIADVDYLIVVCSDKKSLEKSYYDRGIIYSRQQAGASIENMLLKIADLGLASCWVGAFSDLIVKRILKIPENIDVEAILPIGYESGKTKKLMKPELDNVLFFDSWSNKYMRPRNMPESTKV